MLCLLSNVNISSAHVEGTHTFLPDDLGCTFLERRTMSKPLTTERMRLDIRTMQADTRLAWPKFIRWNNGASVTIAFREAAATIEMRVPRQATCTAHMELDSTPLNFGGQRAWWKCPCCHARVGVLYWQACRWQCRKCAGLVHESTRESESSLAYARVNKVRRKLGWGGGMLSPLGTRKKGMHWKTYARLMQELAEVSVAAAGAGDANIERLSKRIKRIRMPSRP